MESIFSLLNKQVVSMLECKNEGIIKDLCLTKNLSKIKWLLVEQNNEEGKTYKVIKPNNIYHYLNDVVTIKQDSFLLDLESNKDNYESNLPLNSTVILTNGNLLGKISNIYFDEKFNIIDLELDDGKKLNKESIIKFNKENTILKMQGESLKLTKKKPKITNSSKYKEVKVEIQNSISPVSVLGNYEYLLNKKLRFDIPLSDGTIYKRGSKVNEHLIKMATKENKIKRLLISCLGNIDFF